MATQSLQRSMRYYRAAGWNVWIVERYVWRIRVDLFNLFDAIGIRSDQKGVLGIQACGSDYAGHRKKMRENPMLEVWKDNGNHAALIGWTKKGAKGKRKLWKERIEIL